MFKEFYISRFDHVKVFISSLSTILLHIYWLANLCTESYSSMTKCSASVPPQRGLGRHEKDFKAPRQWQHRGSNNPRSAESQNKTSQEKKLPRLTCWTIEGIICWKPTRFMFLPAVRGRYGPFVWFSVCSMWSFHWWDHRVNQLASDSQQHMCMQVRKCRQMKVHFLCVMNICKIKLSLKAMFLNCVLFFLWDSIYSIYPSIQPNPKQVTVGVLSELKIYIS